MYSAVKLNIGARGKVGERKDAGGAGGTEEAIQNPKSKI